MQPDEIKQRLSCRRPDSDDQALPELAAAWEAAQADPELQQWAQSEEAFDAALADAFSEEIDIPADLRARLLAIETATQAVSAANHSTADSHTAATVGMAASVSEADREKEKIRPNAPHIKAAPVNPSVSDVTRKQPNFLSRFAAFFTRAPFQRIYGPVATVGAFAIAAVAFLLFSDPNSVVANEASELPSFYSELASHYALQEKASHTADSLEEIRKTLRAKDAPQPYKLSAAIVRLKKLGCGVIHWKGRKVSFIPMQIEGQKTVHYLYIISRESMPDPDEAPFESEEVHERYGLAMRSWSGSANLYILLSPISEAP